MVPPRCHRLHAPATLGRLLLQACEQYFTWSQQLAHFFRHVNGRPQVAQTFDGS